MVKFCNLPKEVCRHLVGEHHSRSHHMVVGVVIMVIGVGVVKLLETVHLPGLHFTADVIGYGLHGLGLTPFVEIALETAAAE